MDNAFAVNGSGNIIIQGQHFNSGGEEAKDALRKRRAMAYQTALHIWIAFLEKNLDQSMRIALINSSLDQLGVRLERPVSYYIRAEGKNSLETFVEVFPIIVGALSSKNDLSQYYFGIGFNMVLYHIKDLLKGQGGDESVLRGYINDGLSNISAPQSISYSNFSNENDWLNAVHKFAAAGGQ